jgi:hypothetical protein
MSTKFFRYENNFYNLNKLISSEARLDQNELILTFEGGVEKTLKYSDNEGFLLFIFNPFRQAIEKGDYKWKPSEKKLKQYRENR